MAKPDASVPECSAYAPDHSCDLSISHEADIALCNDLEQLADGLPGLPGAPELRRLTERLERASRRWQGRSESALLENCDAARLCRLLDSVHAEDVIEALWAQWQSGKSENVERLAYMLRALFDGRRRAIAIERLALGCSDCHSSAID